MIVLSKREATALGLIDKRKSGTTVKGTATKTCQWEANTFPGGVWIQIPFIPPSLNVWKNWHWAKQGRYKKKLAENIRLLKVAFNLPFYERATVQVVYFFPDARERDKDNYGGKFILDALRHGGVIRNDNSDVLELPEPKFDIDREKPRTEVFVWERK
ncbi:MAG: Endodeoxyribonuclease RusA [Pelotomaculum sp. PtaU1.Bin065]|nr:MAG: Endodeoxyribonuclease RusA [Pelotomaculum sp. PtaU1.Bin065]